MSRRESRPAANGTAPESGRTDTQHTAYDRLLDALRSAGKTVHVNGITAKAQCPAHDDKTPSLGLRASEGHVLLYCHAGCRAGDIVAALGLTMSALFDNPRGQSYVYPDGRITDRTPTKRFKQRGNTKGNKLFHADRLNFDTTTAFVVEGEKDVLAVESVGAVAICSAMGAGKARLADWSPLKGLDVVIVQDRDEPGREHANDIAELLRGVAKSVRIAEAAVGKDVSDHIAGGKNLDELVAPSLLNKLAVSADWLDAQTFDALEYVVPELVCEGLGMLAAPPKKGKSFLVGNIALAVAAGGIALGCIPVTQRPVLYLALEDGHRRLQDRFRKMNSGQPLPPLLELIIRATPIEAVAVIAEYLERHGETKPLVILDTLGKVKRPKRANEDAYQADYAVGSELKQLADSAPGSTLLVVHHTRKAEAADFIDTVSGTQGVAGSVDYVMVLARERHRNNAVLSVTGRDVIEAEYALHADDGYLWRLDGSTLAESRSRAESVRLWTELEKTHGKRSVELVRFVNNRELTTATEVAEHFSMDTKRASESLARLAQAGWVTKCGRGQFGPGGLLESADIADTAAATDTAVTDPPLLSAHSAASAPSTHAAVSARSSSKSRCVVCQRVVTSGQIDRHGQPCHLGCIERRATEGG